MSMVVKSERFENAIIDTSDMTITEYDTDSVRTYSLLELLKRWDGVVGVTLTIRRSIQLPPNDGRDEY